MGAVIDIQTDSKLSYVLQLADNAMILGQRLSEWCGHGPVLEQDIAITNIALDLIGEARILYQYAAEIEGGGKTEDDYPYKRDIRQWKNLLLVEIAVDCSAIQEKAMAKFESVIEEATLQTPEVKVPQKGGKQGIHTEYMGYILAEMQFLQKSYPNSKW